ncbi:MAG: hypothetical protein ISS78_10885 [Phycisphaerae bacterium]|nr:hypothetical protein [Phycisphaerae bacterium]
MAITFRCEHCGKEVKAPDGAGGKRGKCPHCGQSNYIPTPTGQDDVIPLAEIDTEEEKQRQEQEKALLEQERELIAETAPPQAAPLDQREDLTSEDLHHLVINYCLDMAAGKLERAETHVTELKKHGRLGTTAVDEFLKGKATEPALNDIPAPVLQGFLKQLRGNVG